MAITGSKHLPALENLIKYIIFLVKIFTRISPLSHVSPYYPQNRRVSKSAVQLRGLALKITDCLVLILCYIYFSVLNALVRHCCLLCWLWQSLMLTTFWHIYSGIYVRRNIFFDCWCHTKLCAYNYIYWCAHACPLAHTDLSHSNNCLVFAFSLPASSRLCAQLFQSPT